MNRSPAPASPEKRARLRLFLAGVALLLAALLYRTFASESERLLQLRRFRYFARVANGHLYLVEGRTDGTLVETSLSGAGGRNLTSGFAPRAGVEVEARPEELLVSWWEPAPPALPGRPPVPVPGNVRRLRRVPLNGGPPQDLLPGETPLQAAAVGRSLFWMRPRPDAPGADLMLSPLEGGAARKIATALSPMTALLKGERRIFWQSPADGISPPCLYSVSEDGGEIGLVEDADSSLAAPTEWEGRFYWLENRLAPNRALYSVRTDGTDRRLALQPLPGQSLDWLCAYRGVLYCVTSRRPHRNGRPGRAVTQLNRIRPGRQTVLEPVATLPPGSDPGGQFDGDYFYFIVREIRENWLDWSPEGLSPRAYRYLHRVRLTR